MEKTCIPEKVLKKMMEAKFLFVDQAKNFDELAGLFIAMVAAVADRHPDEIDKLLHSLYYAKTVEDGIDGESIN